jgi:hypothetical protein
MREPPLPSTAFFVLWGCSLVGLVGSFVGSLVWHVPEFVVHFVRNRPFLASFEAGSPQNRVKRRNSASAECSNRNRHTLIAVRRTFPLVGPI